MDGLGSEKKSYNKKSILIDETIHFFRIPCYDWIDGDKTRPSGRQIKHRTMVNRVTQQYTRGQTIILEGAIGDSTFRIISGEVIICKKSEKGEQIPLAKLSQGEMFGEMYLFERNLTRTATAIALSGQVMLEVLHQDEVRSMMNPLHPALNRIFEGLSLRLNKISRKYVHLLTAQKVGDEQLLGDKNSYIHRPPTD